MLIDNCHGILQNLSRSVSVLPLFQLHLMETKLVQETLAQIAAGDSGGIQLLNDL
jgi:hypothetical protein